MLLQDQVFDLARSYGRLYLKNGFKQEGDYLLVGSPDETYVKDNSGEYGIYVFTPGPGPSQTTGGVMYGIANDGDMSPEDTSPYTHSSFFLMSTEQQGSSQGGTYAIGNSGDVSPHTRGPTGRTIGVGNDGDVSPRSDESDTGGSIGIANNGDVSPYAGGSNAFYGVNGGVLNNGNVSPEAGRSNGFHGGVFGVGNNGDVHSKDSDPYGYYTYQDGKTYEKETNGELFVVGLFNSGTTQSDDMYLDTIPMLVLGFNRDGYLQLTAWAVQQEQQTYIDTNFIFDPVMELLYDDDYTPTGKGVIDPRDGQALNPNDDVDETEAQVESAQGTAESTISPYVQNYDDIESFLTDYVNYHIEAANSLPTLPPEPAGTELGDILGYVVSVEYWGLDLAMYSSDYVKGALPEADDVLPLIFGIPGDDPTAIVDAASENLPAGELAQIMVEVEQFVNEQTGFNEALVGFVSSETDYLSDYVDRNTEYVQNYMAAKVEQYSADTLMMPLDEVMYEFEGAGEGSALKMLADIYFESA